MGSVSEILIKIAPLIFGFVPIVFAELCYVIKQCGVRKQRDTGWTILRKYDVDIRRLFSAR
jgi:hypothetical protein